MSKKKNVSEDIYPASDSYSGQDISLFLRNST